MLEGLRVFPRLGYVAADLDPKAVPHLLSLDSRIAQDTKSSEDRSMKTAYVVRELVSLPAGENEFLTHLEYGTFRTYKEANECAIATKNPRCFPQREQFLESKQEDTFVN
jgi:hypothetical protein